MDNPAAAVAIGQHPARPAALAERLLNFILFVSVLLSAIAFIEPSPHDVIMFWLLVACFAARLPFDRKLIPLLLLIVTWLVGGLASLTQVGDQLKDIVYTGISIYLGTAAVMYACLFSDGNPVRLAILRRAYIIAALIATAAGYVGFFHLLPDSSLFLHDNGRVSATFKDPNVYGPFLIFPLLLLIIELITRGIRLGSLVTVTVLLSGLFLSFSRGAWGHFVVSAAVGLAILVAVTPNPRLRARIVVFGATAAIVVILLVIAMTSIDSIHNMFVERAHLLQSYDVGPGGRFTDQRLALGVILEHPNGMGPFEFYRIFGEQQHNVYMQGFLVYGWLGGAAFLTLVVTTLLLGLRVVAVPSPWQYYLIAAYATFVGEAAEGLVIDSDHWRHLFLLLGLIWGLTVATVNFRRSRYQSSTWPVGQPDAEELPAAL